MNRKFLTLTLLLLLNASTGFAQSLPELIEELLAKNPAIQSHHAKIKALSAEPSVASSLPDPKVGVEAMNIPVENPSFSRTEMSGWNFSLEQEVPFPGKRGLKKKIAKSERDEFTQEHLEMQNQLVAQFKAAYFDYAFATEAIAIGEKSKARLLALSKTMEADYATGKITQKDLLDTKIEVSKIEENLLELKSEQKILRERINTLLTRPAETPLTLNREEKRLTAISAAPNALREKALANRPWLKRQEVEVKKAEQQHRLAKRSWLPDFEFMGAYTLRDDKLMGAVGGEDFFSAGVKITIPLWGLKKQRKEVIKNRYEVKAAKEKKNSIQQEVAYEVNQYTSELEQRRSQYLLYAQKIVPQSLASLNNSKRNYEAGQLDFFRLIDSERMLLENETMMAKHFYEHEKTAALLEMAVGGNINENKL